MSLKTDLDKIEKKLKDAIEKLKTPTRLQEIGDFSADLIRKRTRLGYGVDSTGSEKQKLKPLSDSYKQQRAGKISFITKKAKRGNVIIPIKPKQKPELSESTTASKSNLTNSGQMLDSIKAKVSTNKVSIKPTGSRKNSLLNNLEVAEFVSKDRPFNNLSNKEIKQLRDFVAQMLKLITKYL